MADDPKSSDANGTSDPIESAISAAAATGRKRQPPILDLKATDTTSASERPGDGNPPPDAVIEAPPAAEATTVLPAEEAGSPAEGAGSPADGANSSESTKFSFAPDAGSSDATSAELPPAEPFAAGDTPPPPASPSRSSFGGALVAGALGAVLMLVVLGMLWVSGLFGGDSMLLTERTNRLEMQLRGLAERPATTPAPTFDGSKLDDMTKRLAALEVAKPSSGAPDTTLTPRIETLESTVQALSRRLDATANTAREAAAQPSVPPAEIEALNTRILALDSGIKSLQADVAKRFAAGIIDPAARRAVTAEALRVAVERGEPFADQLKAAQPLAANNVLAPNALGALQPFAAQGVPTPAVLSRELTALIPALRSAQPSAPGADGGFMQKLSANAERLVRVRPVNETAGDDPAALLTRIEARAQQNDIDSALTELKKLPAETRAPADAWIKKVQARRDAVQAARQFSSVSMNQLTPDSSSTR